MLSQATKTQGRARPRIGGACESPLSLAAAAAAPAGWVAEYRADRPGLEVLQAELDAWIAQHDDALEQQRKQQEAAAVDDDGWTVRKMAFPQAKSAGIAMHMRFWARIRCRMVPGWCQDGARMVAPLGLHQMGCVPTQPEEGCSDPTCTALSV